MDWNKKKIACACTTVLFAVLLACVTASKTDRVFIKTNEESLSDGTVDYIRLPEGWRYSGKYPYRIGRVKDGNALYAADENETIVNERKNWYEDMDRGTWMLSGYNMPDPMTEKYRLEVAVIRDGIIDVLKDTYVLSERASNELITMYRTHMSNGTELEKRIDKSDETLVYFSLWPESVPGLVWYHPFSAIHKDGIIVIAFIQDDIKIPIGVVTPDMALYQEVMPLIK